MKPYTYLIGWPEHDFWYYGVRYANGCHPDDFWVTYYTSSNKVKEAIIKYGNPTIKQIRKTFTDKSVARLWENRVLKRMKVVNSSRWLNRTDNKSIAPLYGEDHPHKKGKLSHMYGVNRPNIAEQQKERFNNNSHQFLDPEVRAKSVATRSGDNHHMKRSDIAIKVTGENHYSKKPGYIQPKSTCCYCGNTYSSSNIGKHKNYCKSNLTSLVGNTDSRVYNQL